MAADRDPGRHRRPGEDGDGGRPVTARRAGRTGWPATGRLRGLCGRSNVTGGRSAWGTAGRGGVPSFSARAQASCLRTWCSVGGLVGLRLVRGLWCVAVVSGPLGDGHGDADDAEQDTAEREPAAVGGGGGQAERETGGGEGRCCLAMRASRGRWAMGGQRRSGLRGRARLPTRRGRGTRARLPRRPRLRHRPAPWPQLDRADRQHPRADYSTSPQHQRNSPHRRRGLPLIGRVNGRCPLGRSALPVRVPRKGYAQGGMYRPM